MCAAARPTDAVTTAHPRLDVLINNGGFFKMALTWASNGLDVRSEVNTLAPYLLARHLLPALGAGDRLVDLTSAA